MIYTIIAEKPTKQLTENIKNYRGLQYTQTTWLIASDETPEEIHTKLLPDRYSNRLLVIQAKDNYYGHFTDGGISHMKEKLKKHF